MVAGERSGEQALLIAEATGRAMGKTVIRAADGPGFLVNRCNRPFGLEALRLLQERLAEHRDDRPHRRMAGGFRMGPFELMDLVGVDTGFEVSKSFYAQSFGEPRWRPSPITARYVAAGLHGRKTGRGYYDYSGTASGGQLPLRGPRADRAPRARRGGGGDLRQRAPSPPNYATAPAPPAMRCAPPTPRAEGSCRRWRSTATAPPAEASADLEPGSGGAQLVLCAGASLGRLNPGGQRGRVPRAAPAGRRRTGGADPQRELLAGRRRARRALLQHARQALAWVGDAPGLVLGRIVCQVINEAAFALGEGVGSAADIDLGMELGVSHPRGPFAWADLIGLEHVLSVLKALCDEYREERYRPAPALRRLVAAGRLGRAAGGRLPPAARELAGQLVGYGRGASHIPAAPGVNRADERAPPPFQVFLDENRDAVWRFLVSSVGPVEAEDCFQETFIVGLRAYPRLRAGRTCGHGC